MRLLCIFEVVGWIGEVEAGVAEVFELSFIRPRKTVLPLETPSLDRCCLNKKEDNGLVSASASWSLEEI